MEGKNIGLPFAASFQGRSVVLPRMDSGQRSRDQRNVIPIFLPFHFFASLGIREFRQKDGGQKYRFAFRRLVSMLVIQVCPLRVQSRSAPLIRRHLRDWIIRLCGLRSIRKMPWAGWPTR